MDIVEIQTSSWLLDIVEKNTYWVRIQSVALTKRTDEDLEMVHGRRTAAARCPSEEDRMQAQRTNFTVHHKYVTNKVYFSSFGIQIPPNNHSRGCSQSLLSVFLLLPRLAIFCANIIFILFSSVLSRHSCQSAPKHLEIYECNLLSFFFFLPL